MRHRPRSARLLTAHRAPAAPQPAYRPGGVVRGWAELDAKAPPAPRLAVPPPPRLTREQRRKLRVHAWTWRLLLGGWLGLTGLAVWAGLRFVGVAALGCPTVMVAVALLLAWCAAVDVRQREAEMRAGS
ncbi:hypothetical protein ACGFIY_29425 [Micromonospora chersina]|uniref:hypothetical protein n=1 Tax=Micromonospora chersina TaxID=47854 RepID=UPI003721E617